MSPLDPFAKRIVDADTTSATGGALARDTAKLSLVEGRLDGWLHLLDASLRSQPSAP